LETVLLNEEQHKNFRHQELAGLLETITASTDVDQSIQKQRAERAS
jgi:hypothetical protein